MKPKIPFIVQSIPFNYFVLVWLLVGCGFVFVFVFCFVLFSLVFITLKDSKQKIS